ncbi:MAG: T9SS type A sorting domain-containing protein, partial [Flavobacteriia bacterium]|nr:T9SS type A sorting domain-containing protein [Flavobacteriia bacterium]
INTSTYPEALGTPVVGITTDYDGNVRSATTPTIGADELACSPVVFTVGSQVNVSCNGGNNGSATVSGTGGNGLTYAWSPSGGTAATATALSTGSYTCTVTNICGNSGTVPVTITQPAAITSSQSPTVCAGGSVTVGGNTYTANGTYVDVLTAINGCDSTVTTNLTVSPAITSTQSPTVCAGGSVTVGGNTYTTSGTYVDILTAVSGCDSTVTTNLTVSPVIASSQSPVVCAGGSVSVGGNTYTTSGTYVDILTAVSGCDSTVTTNLTVNPAIASSQSPVVCAGGSVTVGGNTYTTSGTYVDVFTAINGCDSTVTTNLTVNPAIASSQTLTVCAGGSVTVGLNTYTASGTYVDVLTAVGGCDSTVTTNLTVLGAIDVTTSLSGVTISSNQNGATYQWIDCGNANAPIAGATSQSYTPTVNGSYAVIVNLSGCEDTTACVAITTIGLAETTFGDRLSVYPNPSNGVFTIELTDASANAVITNAIGEFVTQMTVVNGLNTLDLQREADGVYFIIITSDNKQQIIKIVKQL